MVAEHADLLVEVRDVLAGGNWHSGLVDSHRHSQLQPSFADQPGQDLQATADDFIARHERRRQPGGQLGGNLRRADKRVSVGLSEFGSDEEACGTAAGNEPGKTFGGDCES